MKFIKYILSLIYSRLTGKECDKCKFYKDGMCTSARYFECIPKISLPGFEEKKRSQYKYLLSGSRMRLAKMYEEWVKERTAWDGPENVIEFLYRKELLNVEACLKFLEDHKEQINNDIIKSRP